MNILIIKDYPGEIKVHKITYNIQEIGLAVALRKKGHECDVMCVSDDNTYHEQHVEIEGQKLTVYSMSAIVILKNGWLKKADDVINRYDIIQICEYNQIYTWHLAKKYNKKMVCYHGPYYCDFNKNYNKMARLFDLLFAGRYRKFHTHFITKSGLAKDYLCSKGFMNVCSIGVGLSPTLLNNSAEDVLPELLPIAEMKCIKLLYIGALEPRRNSFFLLEVLNSLINEGLDVKLVMIGKYRNIEYQNLFENRIAELKLKDFIYYIERVEQKYLGFVYKHSDIFLLPTIYDIYGMVLLEAMYFGIPTITTVNGGSNMMIKNGENGFVINDFNIKSWVDIIKDITLNKDSTETIRRNAHSTIAEHFTWDALADKFIEAYNNKLFDNYEDNSSR